MTILFYAVRLSACLPDWHAYTLEPEPQGPFLTLTVQRTPGSRKLCYRVLPLTERVSLVGPLGKLAARYAPAMFKGARRSLAALPIDLRAPQAMLCSGGYGEPVLA